MRSSISNAVMRAVALDSDLALATMIAGVNIGVEAFDPVGHEFDRPPQHFRQCIGRHLVGIDVDLDAEGAADILADHADLRFLQAEMHCRNILHHVRRLRALIDRQPCLRCVPIGHHGARLQRDAGMAPENELGFDHLVRFGESRSTSPALWVRSKARLSPSEAWMTGVAGSSAVRMSVTASSSLILDCNVLRGVLGRGTARRHDGRDRFALPADALDCDGILRRRF